MRHILCTAMLALAAVSASGDTVADLLEQASAVNTDYRLMTLDAEVAELEYEKAQIEAQSPADGLAAESAYLQARSAIRNARTGYYSSVIAAVFDAASAELAVRQAELSLSIAENAYVYAQTRFDGGLISDEELGQAELQSAQAANSLSNAQYMFRRAKGDLQRTTGLSWMWSLIPPEPGAVVAPDREEYMAADYGVARAQVAVRQAELSLANLAANASRYDRLTTEAAAESARVNLSQARYALDVAFEEAELALETQQSSLEIAFDQFQIQQSLLSDAQARHDRGLITRDTLDQQQIQVYSAHSSYLRALESYISTILGYLVAVDRDPAEVF